MSHINPDDSVMLLIDHQSGLFQLVKDLPVPNLRRNAISLAKVAALLKIPVITSASVPDGPNGPLIPEIHQAAPHASTWHAAGKSMSGIVLTSSRLSRRPCAKL
jgi:nicotinamidase-related amidase